MGGIKMVNKYFNPKSYLRKIISILVAPSLRELGFLNYFSYFVWGPVDRLVIKDSDTCTLVNTLFNTRSGSIYIDEYVRFSHNCMVITGKHNYEAKDVHKFGEVVPEGRDVRIGRGSWITSGVIILGGVTIGQHCVIAAGSVVIEDIPDYSFAAGIPARVVRSI